MVPYRPLMTNCSTSVSCWHMADALRRCSEIFVCYLGSYKTVPVDAILSAVLQDRSPRRLSCWVGVSGRIMRKGE